MSGVGGHVGDEVVGAGGWEHGADLGLGDVVLVLGHDAEGSLDVVRCVGSLAGLDHVLDELVEEHNAVFAVLLHDAGELVLVEVLAERLEARVELEALERSVLVLVEVVKAVAELLELVRGHVGVLLGQDLLLDEVLSLLAEVVEFLPSKLEHLDGELGVAVVRDAGVLELLVGLVGIVVLALVGGDGGVEGDGIGVLLLELLVGGGDGGDGGGLLVDPLVEGLGLLGELEADLLVLLLGGELGGELALTGLDEGLVGVPLVGEVGVGELGVSVLGGSVGAELVGDGTDGLEFGGLVLSGGEEGVEVGLEWETASTDSTTTGSVRISSTESNQMLN